MDDDLSPRARHFIEHAMEEDLPPPSIADGSWEVVISRLTIEAARDAEAPPLASRSPARGRNWIGIIVLGLALAVAGALLWLVLQPRTPVAPPAGAPAAGVSRPSPPPATPPPATPSPARPEHHEVVDTAKLLDEAEAATPTRALELLARHAELAPLGEGSERRMALRISALCALGRTDDARADARAFLGQPRDPKWVRHVKASCAGR